MTYLPTVHLTICSLHQIIQHQMKTARKETSEIIYDTLIWWCTPHKLVKGGNANHSLLPCLNKRRERCLFIYNLFNWTLTQALLLWMV
jgi:hypothetical protein